MSLADDLIKFIQDYEKEGDSNSNQSDNSDSSDSKDNDIDYAKLAAEIVKAQNGAESPKSDSTESSSDTQNKSQDANSDASKQQSSSESDRQNQSGQIDYAKLVQALVSSNQNTTEKVVTQPNPSQKAPSGNDAQSKADAWRAKYNKSMRYEVPNQNNENSSQGDK